MLIFCTGVIIFVFITRFSKLFAFLVQFLAFLLGFENFSHIFCVLIFQAPSCGRAILYAFSISDPRLR